MLVRDKRYKFLADIIMPNSCAFCGKVIRWDALLCQDCENDLPETFCASVAIGNCSGMWSVFVYENEIIDLIYKLKHGGSVYNFAELCAVKLGEKLAENGVADKIDAVIPVPMNIRKRIRRGHDQAVVLAKFIADELGKPVDLTCLRRGSDSTEQHTLSAEERDTHAKEVYFANEGHTDIKGKTILLCDDVITTGSTMSACAAILKDMGAKEIYCVSAAIAASNVEKEE